MSNIDLCTPVLYENSKLSQFGCFLQEMVCWKDHRYIVLSTNGYELNVKNEKIKTSKLKIFIRIIFIITGLFIVAAGYLSVRKIQLSRYSIKLFIPEEQQKEVIPNIINLENTKKQPDVQDVQVVSNESETLKQPEVEDKVVFNDFSRLKILLHGNSKFVSVIKTFVKEKYEMNPQSYTKLTENTFDNIEGLSQYACDNEEFAYILLKFISDNYTTQEAICRKLQHELLQEMIIKNKLQDKKFTSDFKTKITNVLLNILSKIKCSDISAPTESPSEILKNYIVSFIISKNNNEKQLVKLFHAVCKSRDYLAIPFLDLVTNEQIDIIKNAYIPSSFSNKYPKEKNINRDNSRHKIIMAKLFNLFISIQHVITEKRDYIEKGHLRHKILKKILIAFPDFKLESIKTYIAEYDDELDRKEQISKNSAGTLYLFISIYYIFHEIDKASHLDFALLHLEVDERFRGNTNALGRYLGEACAIEDLPVYLSLIKTHPVVLKNFMLEIFASANFERIQKTTQALCAIPKKAEYLDVQTLKDLFETLTSQRKVEDALTIMPRNGYGRITVNEQLRAHIALIHK